MLLGERIVSEVREMVIVQAWIEKVLKISDYQVVKEGSSKKRKVAGLEERLKPSFNYGYDNSFQQLNAQLYSVCFRREKSYCSISYKASVIGNSFSVSTTPANQKSRAGEFSCISDFLIIPRETDGGACSSIYISWSELFWLVYNFLSLVSKS